MSEQRLPVEVWGIIVEHLPLSDQKSCLSVSRLFHDLAVRPLFSMIKICLCWDLGDVDELDLLKSRTWDILDRIVSDRRFASSVKKLVVFSYSVRSPEMFFEQRMLAKAISSMSQLVAFQWIGTAPLTTTLEFPGVVSESIALFCPGLRELALPVDWDFYFSLFNVHKLHALRLSRFHLPSIYCLDEMDHTHSLDVTSLEENFDLGGHLNIIDANHDTLRELDLLGPYVGDVPVRIFNSLTHLEIYVPEGEELSGLSLVFHHASALESLVLAGDIWPLGFFLEINMESLPRLSSFHLSTTAFTLPSEREWQMIGDFIRDRVSLRRLCLRVQTCWSTFYEILPIIKNLPALRTLGLHTGHDNVDLEFLALHLPPTLESLHLALHWNASNMNILSLAPLLGVLEGLSNLTFLHLFGIDDFLPVTAEDMAHDMKRLRIVGRQHRLWDIVRVGDEERLSQWNFLKTKGRIKEDFSDEDGAWLLKYF